MSVKVFLHNIISSHPQAQTLASAFKEFKVTGETSELFGRDAPYDYPKECVQESLYHLHLKTVGAYRLRTWKSTRNPYYRTSDKHLVYCSGYFDPDAYLLIRILEPEAHKDARNIDLMRYLARIASEFRAKI